MLHRVHRDQVVAPRLILCCARRCLLVFQQERQHLPQQIGVVVQALQPSLHAVMQNRLWTTPPDAEPDSSRFSITYLPDQG